MDGALRRRQFTSIQRLLIFIGLSFLSLLQFGCSLGKNHPSMRNALDMLRIERDAAEDQYYELKQRHDEAQWKIEDLESQIKSIQEAPGNATNASHEQPGMPEQLEVIDDFSGQPISSPNEYTNRNVVNIVSAQPETSQSETSQSAVSYIDIDPQLTRGFDSHGKSGDDGIVVAIKPIDHNGRFVAIAAPVTISLIDPTEEGIRQRVGLWKFTSQQVANRIDRKASAFVFRLPWQRYSPKTSNLKLFVRFQADDGKRETNMDLTVSLDGEPRAEWTQVPTPESKIDLSPKSIVAGTDSIQAKVDLNGENSTAGNSSQGVNSTSESPTRIARPEWSPYR